MTQVIAQSRRVPAIGHWSGPGRLRVHRRSEQVAIEAEHLNDEAGQSEARAAALFVAVGLKALHSPLSRRL